MSFVGSFGCSTVLLQLFLRRVQGSKNPFGPTTALSCKPLNFEHVAPKSLFCIVGVSASNSDRTKIPKELRDCALYRQLQTFCDGLTAPMSEERPIPDVTAPQAFRDGLPPFRLALFSHRRFSLSPDRSPLSPVGFRVLKFRAISTQLPSSERWKNLSVQALNPKP